jgi:glycosyltransferase involved in cell wall biosynthesis
VQVQPVHHGVAPATPAGPDALEALAGLGSGSYVLALGTVEPRKGLPALVRAFDAVAAAHADLRLVIAGPDGWGVEGLDAAVGRARHRDRIVRLGWLDADTRAAVVQCAAVFAFPSLYEGFGFPPLEAMSAGVPVVATTAGALPEVLGDGACLVAPGDEEALAEALEIVLVDDEVRSGLIERGRRRASHFTWQAAAVGLASLYRRAADG